MDADGPAQQKGRLKGRPPELNVSRSHAQRACLGGGIALGDLVPVHSIPPSLEVIGAAVDAWANTMRGVDAAAAKPAAALKK